MKRSDDRNGKSTKSWYMILLLAINMCDFHNWMNNYVA